jgi:tetratricopeptide (TPR) repeat protein
MVRLTRLIALAVVFAAAAPADTFLVFPFANLSKNTSIAWIGESVAETVRETLSAGGVVALDRQERDEAFKQLGIKQNVLLTRASMIKIAGALDADQIVYGDFDLTPPPAPVPGGTRGSVRISAHILNLKKMHQGPEFSETGALEDLAALQTRIGWRTLHFLLGPDAPSETDFLAAHPPVRLDAMESYIRGLLSNAKEQKLRLLSQAIHIDPVFSQPYFRLGQLHYGQREYKPATEWLSKVKPSDAHFRESLFLLGVSQFQLSNHAEAQSLFEKLANDVPLSGVLNNIGVAQSKRNLPDAAATLDKAIEADPNDPVPRFNSGYVFWKQSQWAMAAERFRSVLERDSGDAEARQLLDRCEKKIGPRLKDRMEIQERLKTDYEETAYLQLKSVLQPNGKP